MSSRENQNTSDLSDKSHRALQALKVTITPTRNSLQSNTAPVTPTRPSMRHNLTASNNGLSVSMNSNKTPQVQQKANTDANGIDLCPWQVPTDPDDMEDEDNISESPRESKSELPRKSSVKSFSNLTTSGKRARMRRSQSSKKVSKSPVPSKSPKSIVQWPKKVVPEVPKTEKNSARFNEKPRRSLQPMYQSVERNESPKQKKKVMKTAVGDLEFDLGIDEKCATEGDEREVLFEGEVNDKEANLKELGPVRYSKMSEEDAEKVFEMRKRELLAFLIKLGANPSLVKKKLASKNIGLPKQIDTSNGLAAVGFDRDRVIRSLRGTFQENVSPNRFIVYNTDNDPLWNNNGNRGRFATPNARTKTRAASYKISGKTDPVLKRRNSAKLEREKEDLNMAVKKNLTASFNQAVFDGTEMSETRSPVKVKRNRDPQLRNSHQIVLETQDVSEIKSPSKAKKGGDKEEKKEVVESITIDLVKLCSDEKKKKKKKKAKKAKKVKEDERVYQSEQISEANKAPSENISVNTAWESHEESIAYQKLIETMRQKSKLILGDIDQIDMQIQKMKDDGSGKRGKSQKRGREDNAPKRKEIVHEIFLENLEEGYAQAAKMRNSKRSGSYSFAPDVYEATPKGNGVNKRFAGETERLKTGQDTSRTQISRSAKTDIGVEVKGKKNIQQGREKSREMEQKTRGNFENNENRRKNEIEQNARGGFKNDIGSPKTPINRQNLSPNVRQQKNITVDTRQKALSSEKPSFGIDRRPNAIQTQPMTTQADDRNKLLNAFRNPTINETQYVPQKIIEQNLNKSLNATGSAQNYRGGVTTSRPNTALILTNNKKIASSPNMTPTQIPSTATSSKSTIVSKKPLKKGLTMNKSQQSIDKDVSSEMNESADLFDKVKTVKAHKATKSATKSTFSDGVKKILREGSNEDNQPPNPKPAKAMPRSPQFTPKVIESSNRPKFDAPSAADIRAKIYNGTLAKVNVTQNSQNSQNGSSLDLNKRDLKDIVMDDLRYSAMMTKKVNQPETQAPQKNGDLRRKRSISPSQENNAERSAKGKGQISSLQDVGDKNTKGNGIDLEHAERLKLLGQSVKVKGGTNRPYKI